jgi:Rrf2 family protein
MVPDEPQTAQQIAAATRVPLPYLSKVLKSLTRAGVIRSRRGIGGGCSLVREPNAISVYEVIQAVDPLQRIHSCPLGLESHGANLCPLHHRLDEAMSHVEQSFRESTIGELMAIPTTSRPLCPFHIESPAEPGKDSPAEPHS